MTAVLGPDPTTEQRGPSRWRRFVAGGTTPGRLWRWGVALVLACLLTATVSAFSGSTRTNAAGDDGIRLASLDYDTAELYEALEGANASAATGIGADRTTSPTALASYGSYVTSAYLRLDHARGQLEADGPGAADAESIAYALPRYTAGVDAAQALRTLDPTQAQLDLATASQLMSSTILPTADDLQRMQRDALAADYRQAGGFPVALTVLGVLTLVGLVVVSVREARRTRRVLNLGLVVAVVATAVALLWWATASVVATGHVDDAAEHNATASALAQARIVMLQTRGTETAALQAGTPSAAVTASATAQFATDFDQVLRPGGLLDAAQSSPDVGAIRNAVTAWQTALRVQGAGTDGSRVAFTQVTSVLGDAIDSERGERTDALAAASTALTGLAAGPAALLVLAALGTALGIRVRLLEYQGPRGSRAARAT
ncbi:hypothetical protein LQ327_18745 [Actinomycetospora endophytica]|uniref:Secreted protein n=1 Tax=Actinomycetospora endophytica TaxID=2291215 RepID=A0ABS8PBZ0_9PSEU|nr:hypothetical protein [Actinomycetospora endophytica]MCD2195412.1 hypothetical protein [Actinomycetospora endophytica]